MCLDNLNNYSGVLLINPPSFIEGTLNTQPIPLGLIFIDRFISEYGYQSLIVNMSSCRNWDDVNKCLIDVKAPILIGISSYTRQRFSTLELASLLKAKFPQATICLGGPHASFLDRAILKKNAAVDYIIRGEGEETFLKLLEQIVRGTIDNGKFDISGISFMAPGNNYIRNIDRSPISDLSSLPLPLQTEAELELLELSDSLMFHFSKNLSDCLKIAPIITSRGCNGSCSFCCNSAFWGANRCSGAKYSYKQFEYYVDKGIRYFDIYDDNFTSNTAHVFEMCEMLISNSLSVNWWCSSRVDTVSVSMLEKMKAAGCFMISFGVESGSQLILDSIDKNIKVSDIELACKLSRQTGLAFRMTISIGHLGESDATIKETVDLINRLKPSQIAIFMLKVYPGTPIANFLYEKNLLDDSYWFEKENEIVPFFTYEHSKTRLIRFRNYIIDSIQAIIVNRYEDEVSSVELDLDWEGQ